MATSHQFFRLFDLPGEIRNRIYAEVLCCFDSPPPTDPAKNMLRVQCLAIKEPSGIAQAAHSIETNILRTCKQVHREAYDVMIKTNQFIRVQAIQIPLASFLLASQIPIVTMDREHAANFQGYMMGVEILSSGSMWGDVGEPGPRFDFMILGRDWITLCSMLDKADVLSREFRSLVSIRLTLDFHSTRLPDYKAPISSAFFRSIQDTVLTTLRTQLHGFEDVHIQGVTSPKLIEDVLEDIRRSPWNNAGEVLRDIQELKSLGQQSQAESRYLDAIETWMLAIYNMQHMRCGSNAEQLISEGGDGFFGELADLFSTLLYLKVQCVHKHHLVNPSSPPTQHVYTALLIMSPILGNNYFSSMVLPSSLKGEGMDRDLRARMNWHQAVKWRQLGDPKMAELALHLVHLAAEHAPAIQEYQEERNRILALAKTFFEFHW